MQPGQRRLEGPQARHLVRVLRIRAGEQITVFDGTGFEADAIVKAVEGADVELAIGELRAARSEPATAVVLATAVPKGERFDWLVEKGTELGVARLIPLITERSVVVPGTAKLERLQKKVIEASKQCGRSKLMEISPATPWAAFVERELASHGGCVAHPGGEPLAGPPRLHFSPLPPGEGSGVSEHDVRPPPSLPAPLPGGGGSTAPAAAAGINPAACQDQTMRRSEAFIGAIGPEGGFSDGELGMAVAAGAKLVSLGPRVLRIETAALVLAALLSDVTGGQ